MVALRQAKNAYGDKLANGQEVLGHIADIAIEAYALESAMLRTRKMVAARGESECATPIDITRVYASDAADRMEHSGKQVLAALADAPEAAALRDAIRALASHAAHNTVVGRRRIAAAIAKAGRYPF